MLVEKVVHLPELPLRRGRLGGFGGARRVRVRLRQREIPEHEAHPPPQDLLHFLHNRIGAAAMRALVVAIFDERHRRFVGSLAMVGLRDGGREAAHRPALPGASFSSASRIPSAPGLTPTGETYDHRMMPSPSMTKSARSLVPSPARKTPYRRAT